MNYGVGVTTYPSSTSGMVLLLLLCIRTYTDIYIPTHTKLPFYAKVQDKGIIWTNKAHSSRDVIEAL